MKIICFFSLLFILLSPAKAQEMWGISNSNFAGNMGVFVNPSSIVGAPYKYEINAIAADFYAENTAVYFPTDVHLIPRALLNNPLQGKNYYIDQTTALHKGFAHTLIIGPSLIVNNGGRAWGIHTAFRSEVSVLNVPVEFAQLLYDNFRTPELYNLKLSANNLKVTQASWLEIGGTYGSVLRENTHSYLKWAATANLLIGFHAIDLTARTFEFTPLDSLNWIINNADVSFAHALNRDNNLFSIRGAGLSSTVGITYIRNRNPAAFDCVVSNDRMRKYLYRVGLSIMDLGAIRYFRQSEITQITSSSDKFWPGIDSVETGSVQMLDSALLTNLSGITEKKGFNIYTPLALGLQFDYQFIPNVFGNISLVKRLHFLNRQIARPDQISISGRYERRKYEVNLNFSLFEFKQPSLGIAFRYKFLVVGSDRILQLAGLSDVWAFDFFFGLKFMFCKKPFSKGPDCPAYGSIADHCTNN